jgi:hypothetical protein
MNYMAKDINVLKILGKRSNYDKYLKFIKPQVLNTYTRQIFKDITAWYNINPDDTEIDWLGFAEWFKITQHPSFEVSDIASYQHLFDKLDEMVQDSSATESIIKGFIDREYASRMIDALAPVAEGRHGARQFEAIDKLLAEYTQQSQQVTEQEEALVTDDIEELLYQTVGDSGYSWKLKELNVSLGPLRRKNSVMVAGYVDTGKTTFATSELAHIIPQMVGDDQALYFCNEEGGEQVKIRCIQALLGLTSTEIRDDKDMVVRMWKEWQEANPAKFMFYYNTAMTTRFVEQTLKQHKPGLIVFDQLWNIQGFSDSGTNTELYTNLAKWVRRIARQAPVISIHQADGTCNGVKFIEMDALYGSKVGMQGAVDALITIGRPLGDQSAAEERGLYFPKNKLPGGPAPYDSTQSNQKWTVMIDHENACYVGV